MEYRQGSYTVGKLLSLTEDAEKQKHACQEGIKYFKSYTMKHFAEDELVSLEKAVIQTFHELFRLETKLVGDNYSGEDFASGKVFRYRLNYQKQDEKHRQVVLIYEEQVVRAFEFEKQYPPYSLLFRTEKNYFALCIK